jgi:hypothetical protein
MPADDLNTLPCHAQLFAALVNHRQPYDQHAPVPPFNVFLSCNEIVQLPSIRGAWNIRTSGYNPICQ